MRSLKLLANEWVLDNNMCMSDWVVGIWMTR